MDRTLDEKIELVRSLFARKELRDKAIDRFKTLFPEASDSAVDLLAFHLFVDGHEALLDMLSHLELFIRGDIDDIDSGLSYHVQYHLHNYDLVTELIPYNSEDAVIDIDEMINLAQEDEPDMKGILEMLKTLKDRIQGATRPLVIEEPV